MRLPLPLKGVGTIFWVCSVCVSVFLIDTVKKVLKQSQVKTHSGKKEGGELIPIGCSILRL